MIGESQAFRVIQTLIDKIAACDAQVVIEGESGTGKELAARAIHYKSARAARPFVPVNCGAIQDSLIESEFFGHRRGAFTDAREDKPGLVELARGGTLFLDEVDALTAKAQITLLRFLQDQQFRPVGGKRDEQADVRVIAASNRNLERQVEAEAFRLDLLYRLKLLHLALPPLRERPGDIRILARHFVAKAAARYGKTVLPIDDATLAWFERYEWPGNIRELENLVYRAFLLADGDRLTIPAPPTGHAPVSACYALLLNYRHAKNQAIEEFEHRFLAHVLREANGNVSAAARISGTERRHLGRLLKKYGVPKLPSSDL
jgi:two-component system, NtrC family, response regulator GlrR